MNGSCRTGHGAPGPGPGSDVEADPGQSTIEPACRVVQVEQSSIKPDDLAHHVAHPASGPRQMKGREIGRDIPAPSTTVVYIDPAGSPMSVGHRFGSSVCRGWIQHALAATHVHTAYSDIDPFPRAL